MSKTSQTPCCGAMNFEQLVGRTISGPSSDYEVEAVVGLGGQAGILRCNKKLTNETVVLKITNKKDFNKFAEAEEKILEVIAETGRESLNTVTWNDTFMFQGHSCLEFEKLDISLDQYIQENPLGLKEIRPILYQLADALFFLESCQIVHGDLKPVNIMMADRLRRPLKVKLIDFGVAVSNPEDWMGVIRGTPAYMSPEMLLGLPFDLPFDMWSLGCVAAEMLTGAKLFPGGTEHDVISGLLKVMGMPPGHMMSQGFYTDRYFNEEKTAEGPSVWTLKSESSPCHDGSLKDLLVVSPDASDDLEALQSDREAFVDLVTKMLSIDPAQRITPVQMLEHPFFSLSHLDPSRHHNYVKLSAELMQTCDNWNLEDEIDLLPCATGFISTFSDLDSLDDGSSSEPSSAEELSDQEKLSSCSNRSSKKRGRDCLDPTECVSRSMQGQDEMLDSSPRKRRRTSSSSTESLSTADESSTCSTPPRSPRKRKREDHDLDSLDDGSSSELSRAKELSDQEKISSCSNRSSKKRGRDCLDPTECVSRSMQGQVEMLDSSPRKRRKTRKTSSSSAESLRNANESSTCSTPPRSPRKRKREDHDLESQPSPSRRKTEHSFE